MFKFVALFSLVAVATAEIVHPCGDDLSFQCVATYLEGVAGCQAPPEGDLGDLDYPYTIEAPYFKGTVDRYLSTFSGINDAFISEFFTDSDADKTVISVAFPSVKNFGSEVLQYHTPSAIDSEVDTSFVIQYDSIVVTAQWDGVDQITIGTAKVYSEIDIAEYDIQADWPELAEEIDLNPFGIAAKTAQLAAEKPAVLLGEESLYVGRAVARLFWNHRLCSNLP